VLAACAEAGVAVVPFGGGTSVVGGVEPAVGEERIFAADEDRLRHAGGRGYVDLARLRNGSLEAVPDAVLVPADAEAVRRVLAACAAEGVAVVPFGGGTSVVGGVEPLHEGFEAVIALDLGRLDGVEVDRHSLTATLGAGLTGPRAEARLEAGTPGARVLKALRGFLARRRGT